MSGRADVRARFRRRLRARTRALLRGIRELERAIAFADELDVRNSIHVLQSLHTVHDMDTSFLMQDSKFMIRLSRLWLTCWDED